MERLVGKRTCTLFSNNVQVGREPCLSGVLTTEPLGPLAGEQEASYKFLSSIARLEPGQIPTSG